MIPKPKQYVVVLLTRSEDRVISFECIDEAFLEFRTFFRDVVSDSGPHHVERISALYDFGEVVEYIRNWKPVDLSAFEDAISDTPASSQSAHDSPAA